MAKANLVLADGTTVAIEGTADEVAVLLSTFSQSNPVGSSSPGKKKKRRRPSKDGGGPSRKRREGPQAIIASLADEGFFKSKKRTINDIQKKLEEIGHIYPLTNLSTPLLRLVKNKTIRRLKEDGNWVYVTS
jgi:hypothetical protein